MTPATRGVVNLLPQAMQNGQGHFASRHSLLGSGWLMYEVETFYETKVFHVERT